MDIYRATKRSQRVVGVRALAASAARDDREDADRRRYHTGDSRQRVPMDAHGGRSNPRLPTACYTPRFFFASFYACLL